MKPQSVLEIRGTRDKPQKSYSGSFEIENGFFIENH